MRLAVFASGSGSNFQAILEAVAAGTLPAEVVLCVSNKPTAYALERAAAHGVPTAVLDPRSSEFTGEDDYTARLLETLARHRVNFIALAGYMQKIPVAVVGAFRGRILNIHPALLPRFGGKGMYGKHVHRAVLDAGEGESGATVHLVDEEFDTGPIVLQRRVPVQAGDTPETLAARVLTVEHRLYPEALRLFAEHRISVSGREVSVRNPE
jgi:phosphoribosylglycinamide formyltransferase-1